MATKASKLVKDFIKFSAKDKYLEKEKEGWCVFCAIGNAKIDYEIVNPKWNVPLEVLLTNLFTETYYDKPIIDARKFLVLKLKDRKDKFFKSRKSAKDFMLKSIL